MSHIVIDSNSIQARQHLQRTGSRGRLTSFLQLIKGEMGHTVDFREMLTSESDIEDADLLVVLTRSPSCPIDEFLPTAHQFVLNGGSLLLMSNHSRVPVHPRMGHFTEQDGKLARQFGINIMEACFRANTRGVRINVRNTETSSHPLLSSGAGQSVNSVVINNGCAIDRNSQGSPVLLLPGDLVDDGPNDLSATGHAFAWALQTEGGRVLVTSDSGFLGEPNLPGSGPGLFDQGDNRLFIQQAVTWLLTGPQQ